MIKSFKDFVEEQVDEEVIDERYEASMIDSKAYKLVPTVNAKGRPSYRKVRAHRIKVGVEAPSPDDPEVTYGNQSKADDEEMQKPIRQQYADYYNKYMKSLKSQNEEVELEEASRVSESDPPFVLVLKRKSIRMFPSGLKVALYHSEKLNKFFSVPYGEGVMRASIQAEEVEE